MDSWWHVGGGFPDIESLLPPGCPRCRQETTWGLEAYFDGGWHLFALCRGGKLECSYEQTLVWPYGTKVFYPWELEKLGFFVV